MTELKVVEGIVDICSKLHLESVFAPIVDMFPSATKASMISHCLNTELGAALTDDDR